MKKESLDYLKIFYNLIADIESPKEAEEILSQLFAQSELEAVAKKLAVARALKEGKSYQQIKNLFQVSSATISQIQQAAKKQQGILLALDRLTAEEWASKWEKKIKNLFNKF